MKNLKQKELIKKYGLITVAAWIYASGISLFLNPNDLAPGGITGIAMILNRVLGVAIGDMILVLNIPLLLIGLIKFGTRFICSTFYAILMMSLATDVLALYVGSEGLELVKDPFLAALCGGILTAVALGMIFRVGATTGGMDILVKLIRLRFPHIKTNLIFLAGDILVISGAFFVFRRISTALYAMFTVFVMSYVMDMVLYGKDEAILLYIISEQTEKIAERIMGELQLGVTYLPAIGGYQNKEKKIIMCVAKKQHTPKIEKIVKEEDPHVFLVVMRANEIYGEGYKNIYAEKI